MFGFKRKEEKPYKRTRAQEKEIQQQLKEKAKMEAYNAEIKNREDQEKLAEINCIWNEDGDSYEQKLFKDGYVQITGLPCDYANTLEEYKAGVNINQRTIGNFTPEDYLKDKEAMIALLQFRKAFCLAWRNCALKDIGIFYDGAMFGECPRYDVADHWVFQDIPENKNLAPLFKIKFADGVERKEYVNGVETPDYWENIILEDILGFEYRPFIKHGFSKKEQEYDAYGQVIGTYDSREYPDEFMPYFKDYYENYIWPEINRLGLHSEYEKEDCIIRNVDERYDSHAIDMDAEKFIEFCSVLESTFCKGSIPMVVPNIRNEREAVFEPSYSFPSLLYTAINTVKATFKHVAPSDKEFNYTSNPGSFLNTREDPGYKLLAPILSRAKVLVDENNEKVLSLRVSRAKGLISTNYNNRDAYEERHLFIHESTIKEDLEKIILDEIKNLKGSRFWNEKVVVKDRTINDYENIFQHVDDEFQEK